METVMRRWIGYWICLLMVCSASLSFGADFFVSPSGSDTNAGTKEKPFASLERARNEVRALIKKGLAENVTVHVSAGTYFLKKTLTFGPEDSGTDAFSVTYTGPAGEKAVISGGRRITGWKKGDGKLWTAQAPNAGKESWIFRRIYVNGKRTWRARSSYFRLGNVTGGSEGKPLVYNLNPVFLKNWKNVTDVEAVSLGRWAILRRPLKSVEPAKGRLTIAGPYSGPHPALVAKKGVSCFIENALELLDQPGEWYLDRNTRTVTYYPRPGEDMSTAKVIAPVLESLVDVSGTPENPVKNLHFRNLRFSHSNWKLPENGYIGTQACNYVGGEVWNKRPRLSIDGAFTLNRVEKCRVDLCTFSALTNCGIHLAERCIDNAVENCRFVDIGGNGIMVGLPGWAFLKKGSPRVPKNNRVFNNLVKECGTECFGAVGIWAGITERTRIEHNEVHDLPYTGISVGWKWNPDPTAAKNNVIAFNHVHDVMKMLADGGGIYTLGYQPGTIVRGNHIHDLKRGQWAEHGGPIYGLYLDQGSKGFLIEKNVVHNVPKPLRLNRCSKNWHTWKENTITQVLPISRKGIKGNAASILETGKGMEVLHEPRIDPQILTVTAWIKLSRLPGGKDTRRWAVSKNGNEWTAGHFGLLVHGSRAGAYLNPGGGKENCVGIWSKNGAVGTNKWHHLAMTYDGKTLRVFCDAKMCAEKAVGKPRVSVKGILMLGERADKRRGFLLPGLLDEVRIYNRALSAEEIAGQAKNPEAEPPGGCVGYWGFNQDSGVSPVVKSTMDKAGTYSKE